MIVLERIDPPRRTVEFRALGDDDDACRTAFARAGALARQLGLEDVRLHLGEPAHAVSVAGARQGPVAAARSAHAPQAECGVLHRWRLHQGAVEYDLEFAHQPASRDLVALWVPLALVTHGPQEDRLMQLHTGIYEICANILEHGQPLRDPTTFSVGLRLLQDRIDGYVQDGCERFDSARQPFQGVLERVASRERRGFGIHMMLRLIDRIEHKYNETGNRLTFTKGMLP